MRSILWIWWLLVGNWIERSDGFLWTLFGGNNCNCCRCPSPPRFQPQPNFPTLIPQYQSSYAYSYSPHPIAPIVYAQSPTPMYSAPLFTTTASYRGPPAAAPTSQEQLYQERKYSTNQVAYHSESRPVSVSQSDYGNQAMSQLEDELAAEKYKYNLQKAAEKEREEKKQQQKIRVFKMKPHKSSRVNMGMVEWQASQVAKYTNEKAIDKFIEATSDTNGLNENESLEEFIPIEIGSEPEFADEEPAGPPPNVRNRIVFFTYHLIAIKNNDTLLKYNLILSTSPDSPFLIPS
ncbi:hypothetical protein GCK72_013143 [Caenorhabditis remanei]|uniref:Uncharacterized protein n=1 Tax=Caenorhabditis remanei TaxID=31234 RepID=A0A6A5GQE4_CAERE|nr:hypothetical protein GCK72_013143 [Caenorhabditis remanei]KAF1756689.1 hypothetical protein GCK72_013143 [Caenorhabditis remanei]